MTLAILDGTIMDAADAQIPVTDEGLLRGDGVFEVVRLYDGRPFALEEHLARMERSASAIRLPTRRRRASAPTSRRCWPRPRAGRRRAAAASCTRGGRRIALIEPMPGATRHASRLATVTYAPTRVLDGVKSLSYGANMLASRLAKEQGADEALLVTPHGRVLEAPTLVVLLRARAARLCTPPLADHILDSITRRGSWRVTDVDERITTLDDLARRDEAFLASTFKRGPCRSTRSTATRGRAGAGAAHRRGRRERVRERIAAELAAAPT